MALVELLSTRAMEEVRGYNENTILNTPVEDLIEELVEKYKPDVPAINAENTYVSEKENKREEQWRDDFGWSRGGSRTVTENLVTFHVSFTGDATLFTLSPRSRSIPGPQASVNGRELLITMVADRNTPETMKAAFNETIMSINQHLATMRNDFRNVAAHFEGPARQYLEQRRATILQNKNTVSALGFPMKRRERAPTTYIVRQRCGERLPKFVLPRPRLSSLSRRWTRRNTRTSSESSTT
ncbi:hypothetical protein [Methylosinus sp. LW4]|uniref:hypothetical protein n=1 Tax=Methylosinus sp. LW4 TaxID=136993 RepID=UPI0004778292|nr:hypothetical protein [Methylosinus sp. LW4]